MPLCLFSKIWGHILLTIRLLYYSAFIFSGIFLFYFLDSDLSVTSGILDLTLARLIPYYQTCFSSWNRRNYPVWDTCSFIFPKHLQFRYLHICLLCTYASFKLILYSNSEQIFPLKTQQAACSTDLMPTKSVTWRAFSKMYKSLSWGKYPKAHKKNFSKRIHFSQGEKFQYFYLSTRLCKWHNHIYTRRHTHIHLFPAYITGLAWAAATSS